MANRYAIMFNAQEENITHYCFGICGKVIVGGMRDEIFGPLTYCYQENCPYAKSTDTEPFGEVRGEMVYARVLKDVDND